jgi:hypothetical protein
MMAVFEYLDTLLNFPWDHPLLIMIAAGLAYYTISVVSFWRKKGAITQALLTAHLALEAYKKYCPESSLPAYKNVDREGEEALVKIEEVLRGLG